MLSKKESPAFFRHIIVGAFIFLSGCSKPEQLITSQSLSSAETAAVSQQTKSPQSQKPSAAPDLPAPRLPDVQAAVKRTYQMAVIIDESRARSFTVGDFNGDGSQDIAVAVKPAKGMLSEINSEYANWILEDSQKIKMQGSSKAVQRLSQKPRPVQVEANDFLLAVIHGYGPYGWRNPAAKQTYLLKNAAGSNMETQAKKDLLNAVKDIDGFPAVKGDVIKETIGQESGLLLWTGAHYAWYHDVTMKTQQGK